MGLKPFGKGRIPPSKYPRRIAFVAEAPTTANSRIRRFKLCAGQGTSCSTGARGAGVAWRTVAGCAKLKRGASVPALPSLACWRTPSQPGARPIDKDLATVIQKLR